MQDNQTEPTEHFKRGAEEFGRGIIGVRDKAAAGAENLRDTVRNKMPTSREARDKVVMVRVGKDSLDRMDDLVEAGVVKSRSEAADYLITEGIRAKQSFFDQVATKVEEIRRAKEELRRLSDVDRATE